MSPSSERVESSSSQKSRQLPGEIAEREALDSPWASLLESPPELVDTSADAASEPPHTAAPPPAELAAVLEDLHSADAFELDRRLRQAFALEQRLAARMAPLLDHVLRRGVYLAFGHSSRDDYMRERLGLDPASGRRILRIERAAQKSPVLGEAWREGVLTPLQAGTLVPLLGEDLSELNVGAWVERAKGFSLRRLRDDVEAALELREVDYPAWLRTGGLPQEEPDREIRAKHTLVGRDPSPESAGPESEDREIGANPTLPGRDTPPAPETCRITMIVESEVAQLFRATICSLRRLLEQQTARPVTPGQAVGFMSAHVLRAWEVVDGVVPREHRIIARDRYRCAVPGCSRMAGLHRHHLRYRSHGGGNGDENLTTLCAYHHLRGVHGGRLRIRGLAPHALRFELGIRPDGTPLAVYTSGDRRVA